MKLFNGPPYAAQTVAHFLGSATNTLFNVQST